MQVTDQQARSWLENLRKGRTPYDPAFVAIMRGHGYASTGKTRAEVALEASEFLRERIESLRGPRGGSISERLPYRVLEVSFIQGWKLRHAAKQLGMSERQLSRERTRAIRLLRDALTAFPADAPDIETEPTTWADLVEQLARIEATVAQIGTAVLGQAEAAQ